MATHRFDNPFHDLWVSENLDPAAFVKMFSSVLVQDAEALFSTGNIVLKGRQGSGKSMLLTLLETRTRLSYARAKVDYPVPQKQRRFLSAGVHLTQQSASLVAARAAEYSVERRAQTVAANFADYLNSLLCLDLLKAVLQVHEVQQQDPNVMSEVPIVLTHEVQGAFLRTLSKAESWQHLAKGLAKIDTLMDGLEARIRVHRQHANGVIEDFPADFLLTRAQAGIPVAELAVALRGSGVLPEETLILLRIDQHEELFELERNSNLGHIFRQVLNSALARRDPRIAYRIGTRHYAWEADLSSWGSGAPLEEERDYSVIDLDKILRRGEHLKGWKFPALAKDVLARRLDFAGFRAVGDPISCLFGKSMDPHERAKKYVGAAGCNLRFDDDWAPQWQTYLTNLWNEGNPLDAKFGEAWLRQDNQKRRSIPQDGEMAVGMPWRRTEWWPKERNEIALMQLAGDRQQALIWSGERQVIELAGANILAFMTICKSVWATWLRRNPGAVMKQGVLPAFTVDDQLIGISEASQIWFKKIQVGFEADRRSKLITSLGGWFRSRMLRDRRLAYPGHNGFSLRADDLINDDVEIVRLIKVCRDHGDLLESSHTTRNKDQEPRIKWYLHPLLCPLFRIPYVRTKEPIYSSIDEIGGIYGKQRRAGPIPDEEGSNDDVPQLGLPGF